MSGALDFCSERRSDPFRMQVHFCCDSVDYCGLSSRGAM